ncbi:MAG: ketopantoate reductase family protein [Nitriliruptorales bacterium]
MRIAIVGAGGVGGYFGARLAAAGEETWFIARGAHLDAMQTRGLEVRSVDGDLRLDEVAATDDARDVGPCDVVLFCVKSFDTTTVAEDHLPHLVGEHTAVVSLQNGVDNVERIAAVVGREHAVGGLAFIFSGIVEPGIVAHTGGPGRILFGELDGAASARTERLLEACRTAGIDAAIPPDIRVAMWDKFAFICAQAGTTAAVRLPIGDVRGTPETWALFRRLVEETYAVARAVGVDVADGAVEERLAFAESLEPGMFSSLHDDLVAARQMELEGLHGVVVRLAERHGVEVRATAAVHAILAPWAARNAAGSP